ncbi:MAG: diaminopimelate dehydrogenase [Clostridia bacterium]
MQKIKIGIVGYGNIGKAVDFLTSVNKDIEVVCIFTRRKIIEIKDTYCKNIDNLENILDYKGKIDVLVLCLGSYNDLVKNTYKLAKNFNTVDSFDNHKKIINYEENLTKICVKNSTSSIISVGWDPGIFSLFRELFKSILNTNSYTIYGPGVSQGHSELLRKLKGVLYATQYTVPYDDVLERITNNNKTNIDKTNNNKTIKEANKKLYKRECYLVVEDNVDHKKLERYIKSIPSYFKGYETNIHFIDEETYLKNHNNLNHEGKVLIDDTLSKISLNLKLESNPIFTASVMISYIYACNTLSLKKLYGAYNILEIPISYIIKDYKKIEI